MMNHARPSKINISINSQPPIRGPGPVSDHWVYEASDDEAVGEVGCQLAPLCHGTRHDSGCSGAENKLPEPVGERCGLQAYRAYERDICANEAITLAVCKHVTEGPEGHTCQENIKEIFNEDVGGVLGANTASLQQCKPSLQEKDEETVDD